MVSILHTLLKCYWLSCEGIWLCMSMVSNKWNCGTRLNGTNSLLLAFHRGMAWTNHFSMSEPENDSAIRHCCSEERIIVVGHLDQCVQWALTAVILPGVPSPPLTHHALCLSTESCPRLTLHTHFLHFSYCQSNKYSLVFHSSGQTPSSPWNHLQCTVLPCPLRLHDAKTVFLLCASLFPWILSLLRTNSNGSSVPRRV